MTSPRCHLLVNVTLYKLSILEISILLYFVSQKRNLFLLKKGAGIHQQCSTTAGSVLRNVLREWYMVMESQMRVIVNTATCKANV